MSRYYFQKQPSWGVYRKRCSENMQQIYRRTVILKYDFNKAASNFLEIALRYGCSPINLLHIFRTPFPKNTSWWLLLYFVSKSLQEIAIIIILIFCLNFHASRCPYHEYSYLLLIFYQKSVRRDLARERKIC